MGTENLGILDILAAERSIYQTHFRFFRLVDTRQYERIGSCFTPNADIEYRIMPGPPQYFNGRDEFVNFMLAGGKSSGSAVAHVGGQSTVVWEDGRPRLLAYATVWHWASTHTESGAHRPADWTTIGYIEDDYERFEGDWLIAKRLVTPVAGLVAAGAAPGLGRRTPQRASDYE
ncbi:hypothetical protein J19TS2_52160 [Cohnella xylanilytica]|uniref:Nuclear transport factor 2 family protein n=1 Tax=Cohnella xylanilytica TaxID=557555 RepID=A0A841TZS3_9BACL|nr:nuclear transport factor 2 family protein [Cohnella xylanilytica]MBB6691370.1 nuclear transport factor 2 family protein [Cohnella xylanilytica]GIO15661.1 hypothetical protein J19TS2_52160 [Cohnella xylanilytica]